MSGKLNLIRFLIIYNKIKINNCLFHFFTISFYKLYNMAHAIFYLKNFLIFLKRNLTRYFEFICLYYYIQNEVFKY